MSFTIAFRPEANDDIDEAYRYNESRRSGLGDEFLETLGEQVQRISDNPEMYALLHKDIRAAPMRRFSYVVYYRIEGNVVLIVAVHHGHRNPRAWKRRS